MTVEGSWTWISPSSAYAVVARTPQPHSRIFLSMLDTLFTLAFEAQVLAEEGQDVVLEPVTEPAGVIARIDLETMGDPVGVEYLVEPRGVAAQAILVADVDGNRAITPQLADVLVDEVQRRVGIPLRQHLGTWFAIASGQIEVPRRVVRVRRPGRRGRELRPDPERELV